MCINNVCNLVQKSSQRYNIHNKPPLNPRRNTAGVEKYRPNQTLIHDEADLPNLKQGQPFGQRSSSLSKLGQRNYEQMASGNQNTTPVKDIIEDQYEKENVDNFYQQDPREYYENNHESGPQGMHQRSQHRSSSEADESYNRVSYFIRFISNS